MNRQQLADAMRSAIRRPEVIEYFDYFIHAGKSECFVCALGAALVEKFNGDYEKAEAEFQSRYDLIDLAEKVDFAKDGQLRGELEKVIAGMLEISPVLASDISARHFRGESIESIAQWLESDPDWAEGWEETR